MGSGFSTWILPQRKLQLFLDLLIASPAIEHASILLRWISPERKEVWIPKAPQEEPSRCDESLAIGRCRRREFCSLMADPYDLYTLAQFATSGSDRNTSKMPCEEIVLRLSERIEDMVLAVDLVEDDYWEYVLASAGGVLDRFSSRPSYWEQCSVLERNELSGNPQVLAKVLDVPEVAVEPYLVHVDEDRIDPNEKAFPDDDLPLVDPQVAWLFLRRLGLESEGDVLYVKRFTRNG